MTIKVSKIKEPPIIYRHCYDIMIMDHFIAYKDIHTDITKVIQIDRSELWKIEIF